MSLSLYILINVPPKSFRKAWGRLQLDNASFLVYCRASMLANNVSIVREALDSSALLQLFDLARHTHVRALKVHHANSSSVEVGVPEFVFGT